MVRAVLVRFEEIVYREGLGIDMDVRVLASGMLVHELEGARQARREHEPDATEPGDDTERDSHGPEGLYAGPPVGFNAVHATDSYGDDGPIGWGA